MTDLDLSQHSLNLSTSKQRYTIPKSKRFEDRHSKPLCDSFYQIPTSISKRATMLGYGNKSMGEQNKNFIPGVGAYTLQSQINPEKHKKHSISFGVSRERMEQGGPLGNVKKFLQKLPAPGTYQAKNVRDPRGPTLRSRIPDHEFEKYCKLNPGPGTYGHQKFGQKNYYINSVHRNLTNGKISQVSRLEPLSNRKNSVGPASYNPIDEFNAPGRYTLAKNTSTTSCVFPRSNRQGIAEKALQFYPAPGQYNSFSGFG